MKSLLIVFAVLFVTCPAFAQQDTVWRRGGLVSINLSQASLTNWSAGGQNSLAGNGLVSVFAHYKSGKIVWDNNLDLAFGLLKQGKDDITKSDDRIEFTSKYGREAFKN